MDIEDPSGKAYHIQQRETSRNIRTRIALDTVLCFLWDLRLMNALRGII